jgi:ribosomal protein S18 acetylase RimI-like enzyme
MKDDTGRGGDGRQTKTEGTAQPTDDDTGRRQEPAETARRDGASAVRIRRARATDTDELGALHRRALRAAGTDPEDVPGTADLRWVEAAYIDSGGEFLVAEAQEARIAGERQDGEAAAGRIVAMGGLVVDGAVGELYRFAVHPDHQRVGYGSRILDALEEAARERGVTRVMLTTASRQAAAVSFYRDRGYGEVGRERHGKYELVRFAKSLEA